MEDVDDKVEIKDSPAIKALGSLFKLTEVHFWVDICTGLPYGSTSLEYSKTVKDDGNLCDSESNSLHVDTELSRQLNELGLPLSFCTNKEETLQSHFLNWEAFIAILEPERNGTEKSKERRRMLTRKFHIPMKKPHMKLLILLK